MAGKTLRGIGEGEEDESGEHEAPSLDSAVPREALELPSSDKASLHSGPTVVDDTKVADALKRLRSLDTPLGPLTGLSKPAKADESGKVDSPIAGVTEPVVDKPTGRTNFGTLYGFPAPEIPNPAAAATPGPLPASAEAGGGPTNPPVADTFGGRARAPGTQIPLLRPPRPTAVGHSVSTPAAGQPLVPLADEKTLKGTLHGHSLHLPDNLPDDAEQPRSAEVHASTDLVPFSRSMAVSGQVDSVPDADFSHKDSHFFDTDPVNPEFDEPEVRRSNFVLRAAIFVAVVSVFVVAAFAYVKVRRPEAPEAGAAPAAPVPETSTIPSSATVTDNPPPATPPAPAAGAAAAPPSVPVEEPKPVAAPTPPAPAKAIAEPEPAPTHKRSVEKPAVAAEKPARAEAKPVERHGAQTRRPSPATEPAPRPAHGAAAVTVPATAKPAHPAAGGKRPKVEEDPDGTLPPSLD